MTLNQILLIGYAGTDPEMRTTSSGTAVTHFQLAVSNNRRDQNGEWTQDTEWFAVTAWDRQAESVNQYLSKGSHVFVEGRFSTSQYTSNSGEARTNLEVSAFKVGFLDYPSGKSTIDGVQTGTGFENIYVGREGEEEEKVQEQDREVEERQAREAEAARRMIEHGNDEQQEPNDYPYEWEERDLDTDIDDLAPEGMGSEEMDWESMDYE